MKEYREKIMSYLVTLGFVIFILLFLSSLVFLSRLALSQDSQFGTYVSSAQNLLKEIDKVQKDVENINISRNQGYIRFPEEISVEDFSTITTSSGKSFITYKLDRPTFIVDDILYFEPFSKHDLTNGDMVILDSGEIAYALESGESNDADFTFYIVAKRTFQQGNVTSVRGVALYENSQENYNST